MGKTGLKRLERESQAGSADTILRGSALATVDDDGRIKLPAGFRRTIESAHGARLYLTSLTGDSLWIYPLATWQRKERRILSLARRTPAVEKFITRTSYFGGEATLDSQGRALVPQLLRAAARLAGEVAVLGALDHLEVWNNALLRTRLAKEPLSLDDRNALAELLL